MGDGSGVYWIDARTAAFRGAVAAVRRRRLKPFDQRLDEVNAQKVCFVTNG
jgi:hypothetical protein